MPSSSGLEPIRIALLQMRGRSLGRSNGRPRAAWLFKTSTWVQSPKSSDSGVFSSIRCSTLQCILIAFMIKPNAAYVACGIPAAPRPALLALLLFPFESPRTCSVLEEPRPCPGATPMRTWLQYPLSELLSRFLHRSCHNCNNSFAKVKKKKERKKVSHPLYL